MTYAGAMPHLRHAQQLAHRHPFVNEGTNVPARLAKRQRPFQRHERISGPALGLQGDRAQDMALDDPALPIQGAGCTQQFVDQEQGFLGASLPDAQPCLERPLVLA